jgi:hypothetical protein
MKKEQIKKFGIWCLAAALLASHLLFRSVAHAEERGVSPWQQVLAKTGDCSIAFPSIPQVVHRSLKVSSAGHQLHYDVYLAPLNEQTLCLLLVATYPQSLPKGQELSGLEGLLNGIIGHNPDHQLVFANVIDYQGHQAVDFSIRSSASYFRGQALMIGNKLYLMAMEGHESELDEEAYATFVRSFSLIKK